MALAPISSASMHTLEQLRSGALAGTRRLDLSCDLRTVPPEVFDLADNISLHHHRLNCCLTTPAMKKTNLYNFALGFACTMVMATAYSEDLPAPISVPASGSVPAPAPALSTGSLTVTYSTKFIDGSRLKAKPTEVGIVTRSHTTTAVAGQVAVNALSLVAGGGISFGGFGKDDLVGAPIEGVQERGHLQNPVPESFVANLQLAVNQFLEKDAKLRDTTFKKPLIVAGGSARLVYETLAGNDEEQYRLKAYVMVYKDKERWSIMPNPPVFCAMQSPQAMLLPDWAVDNFRGVRAQLDEMLAGCQAKVLDALTVMLKS